MPHVKLDERYFENIRLDYANWQFSWAKEAGQNALDAGATSIVATVAEDASGTTVTWHDNGCGMDRETIVNKFMAVGASGKEWRNDKIGGYGVAKLLLAFAHRTYTIETGELLVTGSGGDYMIEPIREPVKGTKLSVLMDAGLGISMVAAMKRWIAGTMTECTFTVNGEVVKSDRLSLRPPVRRHLDWCDLYVYGSIDDGRIDVRLRGQLMFSRSLSQKELVVVELNPENVSKCLTSNRDSLRYPYYDKLDRLVELLLVDPGTILLSDTQTIDLWAGRPICLNKFMEKVRDMVGDSGSDGPSGVSQAALCDKISDRSDRSGGLVGHNSSIVRKIDHDQSAGLMVVNRLTVPVPVEFIPSLGDYARRLYRRWAAVVESVVNIVYDAKVGQFQHYLTSDQIVVGWVFDPGVRAMMCRHGSTCGVLLNPVVVDGKSMTHRWGFGWNDFTQLVSTAAHEITHIIHGYHGEDWGVSYTDVMSAVMANIKKVNDLYHRT